MELDTSQDFDSEIAEGVVLVDFHARWCGPCKHLTPVLAKITGAKIIKVDIDDHTALAAKHNIMSVPTLMFFKDGKMVETLMGVQSESVLQGKVNQLNG